MKTTGPKNPKKALIYYYVAAVVILLLFKALVFPNIMRGSVTEVSYNRFVTDLEEGKVSVVQEDASNGTIT